MYGVDHGCDCVGYQGRDDEDPSHENPMLVPEDLIEFVTPTGKISTAGAYRSHRITERK
jgi:hypothetical protein